MQLDVVLGVLDMLGAGGPARTLVVGCEPASVDYGMELSEPVAGAVDEAVRVILGLVAEAGRTSQGAGTCGPAGPGPDDPRPEDPGFAGPGPADPRIPGIPAAEDPQISETTGEGVSHVP